MRSWTLRGKLLAIPAFTALMLVVASVMVLQTHREFERRIQEAMAKEMAQRRAVFGAMADLTHAHVHVLEESHRSSTVQAAGIVMPMPSTEALRTMREHASALRKLLDPLRDGTGPTEPWNAALIAAHSDLVRYENTISHYEKIAHPSLVQARQVLIDAGVSLDSLGSRMRVLSRLKHAAVEEALERAKQKVTQDWELIALYLVIGGAVVLICCWTFAGAISRRLNTLLSATREFIWNGSATLELDFSSQDEVAELARGFDGAMTNIRERDTALRRAADEAIAAEKVLRAEIEDRCQVEADLRRTTEFLALAQAAGGFGIFDLDLPSGIIRGSPMFFELLGIETNDTSLTRDEWLSSIHPEDLDSFVQQFTEAVESGGQYLTEYRSLWPNGVVRWLTGRGRVMRDTTDQPVRVIGTITDITARHELGEQLRNTTQSLTIAQSSAGVATFDLDVFKHRFTCSDNYFALLNVAKGSNAFDSQELYACVHPDDRHIVTAFQEAQPGEDTPHREFRVVLDSGKIRWIDERCEVERDVDGSVRRISGAIVDVSDRRRAQDAVLEAKRAAEAANSAKSDFLANMSHEIRTPMNGVIGVAGLLHTTNLDKLQREYVDIIRGSAETLLSLLNDVLDFSKIEAGRLEIEQIDFEIRTPIYETCSALALQGAVKGIELIANVHPEVPQFMRGDPGRVRQIVSNLISNALKFTHEGQVIVYMEHFAGPDDVAIIKIEVTDTGIGIPPDRMDRLFKQFTQVDSSTTRHYGGTGLGLSIVKRLTELMGGTVGVRSTPGQGSTFWVKFPIKVCAEQAPVVQVGRGYRVLVVDDVKASREGLKVKLETFSFECVLAESVDEAMRILDSRSDIDLVVADEIMPRRGGLDLLNEMRATPAHAKTPFMLLAMIGAPLNFKNLEHQPNAVGLKPIRSKNISSMAAALISGERSPLVSTPISASTEVYPLNARVLLVEDNAVNQRVAQRLLQTMSVDVVTCNNGAEALEHLSKDCRFDAVLMDCQMPVMDGFTATKKIREIEAQAAQEHGGSRRLPIIALTANVMREDRERCIAAGMDAHLGKPIQPTQLRDCLSRFVDTQIKQVVDVQAIRDLTGGDMDFERELIETFISSGDQNLADIVEALQQQDLVTIGNRAHTLKGSSANMHAADLSAAAANLEQAARKFTNQNIGELVDQLAVRLREVNAQLRQAG